MEKYKASVRETKTKSFKLIKNQNTKIEDIKINPDCQLPPDAYYKSLRSVDMLSSATGSVVMCTDLKRSRCIS